VDEVIVAMYLVNFGFVGVPNLGWSTIATLTGLVATLRE
jgi:hypothetical protein